MEKQFLIAGFGGQGVLLIGQLIAKAAMRQGYEVSWMPSYAPKCAAAKPTAPWWSATSPSAARWSASRPCWWP